MNDKRTGLGRQGIRAGAILGALLTLSPCFIFAQTCVTQAKMTSDVRDGLSTVALTLAQAVQAADVAKVQGMTIAEFSSASAFGPTESLMQSTASRMGNGELRVVQIYELDARSRAANDTSDADFNCALAGTTSRPTLRSRVFLAGCTDSPWLKRLETIRGCFPSCCVRMMECGSWLGFTRVHGRRRGTMVSGIGSRHGRMPKPMSFGWRGFSMDRRRSFYARLIS